MAVVVSIKPHIYLYTYIKVTRCASLEYRCVLAAPPYSAIFLPQHHLTQLYFYRSTTLLSYIFTTGSVVVKAPCYKLGRMFRTR
jgi:hypothetical protein